MLRSYRSIVEQEPGFDPTGVLTTEITLSWTGYENDAAKTGFWETLEEQIRVRESCGPASDDSGFGRVAVHE